MISVQTGAKVTYLEWKSCVVKKIKDKIKQVQKREVHYAKRISCVVHEEKKM